MNQSIKMWQQSNERMNIIMKAILSGQSKPDIELITAAQREFEDEIKLMNVHFNALKMAAGQKKAAEKVNLFDESQAINLMLDSPDDDNVKCPIWSMPITRQSCLDYSGNHYEECLGCEIGKATKDKLLPNHR